MVIHANDTPATFAAVVGPRRLHTIALLAYGHELSLQVVYVVGCEIEAASRALCEHIVNLLRRSLSVLLILILILLICCPRLVSGKVHLIVVACRRPL